MRAILNSDELRTRFLDEVFDPSINTRARAIALLSAFDAFRAIGSDNMSAEQQLAFERIRDWYNAQPAASIEQARSDLRAIYSSIIVGEHNRVGYLPAIGGDPMAEPPIPPEIPEMDIDEFRFLDRHEI